jgi:hypothetical protein
VDNVTLTPDVAGTYEAGLRVDDGLDNSALFIHAFTAAGTPPSPSGGGGGGGCSIVHRKDPGTSSASVAVLLLLFLPAYVLAARRRIIRTRPCASRVLPPGRRAGP